MKKPPRFEGKLNVVEQRLTRFEVRYNTAAKPFKWKFATNDLANLLERLDRHQEAQTPNGPNMRQPDPRRTYKPDH